MTHIKDLIPDPKNRRAHNPRNIGMLVDALHNVGASRSIVVDENDVILAGNGVVEAASEAGLTKVQIVEADGDTIIAVKRRGLTDAQKRDLAIYDNRTAELATWNVEQLREDLADGLSFQAFFFEGEFTALLASLPDSASASASLSERFGVPPFSVLDARQGYWQDRKRVWLALGIESELGRGEQLIPNGGGATSHERYKEWGKSRREPTTGDDVT